MKTKERLYAVIGGMVGAVLTLVVCLISPLGAQNDAKDVVFGKITCTKIAVKQSGISEKIVLAPGNIIMGTSEKVGVHVFVIGNKGIVSLGEGRVAISGGESSGYLSVNGENGKVGIESTEDGGRVYVTGGDDNPRAVMGVDERDGGSVIVSGKDSKYGIVHLNVSEHGGAIQVFGKGEGDSRVNIGVNEYGNGAVSTWDKNGYRLASLK